MAVASTRGSPKAKGCMICLFLFGVVCLVVGLVLGIVVANKIDHSLKTASRVCGTGDSGFDDWKTNTDEDDAPKYKLYFGFNATNAAEYLGQGPTTPVDLKLDMLGQYAMRQYDTFYNISFTNDNQQVSYKTWTRYDFKQTESCPTCTAIDRFTNLNPGVLGAISTAGSELVLGLTFSNLDLTYGTMHTCNSTTIAYSLSVNPNCSPLDPNTPLCCCNQTATQLDPTNPTGCFKRASNLYSTFAKYDNGVDFTSPTVGPTTSPLFINKNVHEFAYGYPSGLLGLAGAPLLAKAGKTDELNKMAAYTELVMKACNYSSDGIAPAVEDLVGKPYQILGLITCAPVAASRFWADNLGGKQRCSYPAPNNVGCMCQNSEHGEGGLSTLAKPCCTKIGLGCLYRVIGYVTDEMYLTKDQSFLDYPTDNTTQNTGCGDFEDDKDFWWSQYESKPATPSWYQGSRPLYAQPTQQDIALAKANPTQIYFAPVMGGDGTRAKGAGKTSSRYSKHLSDDSVSPTSRVVYITQVYRSTNVYYTGTHKFEGIPTHRYSPAKNFLNQGVLAQPGGIDNGQVGAATPFSGVQQITFEVGFPAFVSRPLFLHGDEDALSQKAGCAQNKTSCAGIQVFVQGKQITNTDVSEDTYETYLDVEPTSGMTLRGHKRLQASFGLWRCANVTQGCRPDIGVGIGAANLLSPFTPGDKVIPQYYMDETSQATSKQVSKFKDVESLAYTVDVLMAFFVALGCVVIVGSFVWGFTLHRKSSPTSATESLMSNRSKV